MKLPMLSVDRHPSFLIELTEWDKIGPAQEPRLRGCTLASDLPARRLVEALRGRLDIHEGYEGLEIASTSFVGIVELGQIRIAIGPKLPAMPLARLLRYAYGLRDISTLNETNAPTSSYGLHDLLIELLASEVEELVHRGLPRRYVQLSEKLENPRGSILVDQMIREGGLREARLPCSYFQRRADWHLNRVLRAGLESAMRLTDDHGLRRRVQQLSSMFGDVESMKGFCASDIDRAERELTRLTATALPALTIIRLLQDMQGVVFDAAQESERMPGFLFDMNLFFEHLLSRFLRDNLPDGSIKDQKAIRHLFAYSADSNPRNRRPPRPRPDYAFYCGGKLSSFMDAKYRDVWDRGLPSEWLYQLSIYALASPSKTSVLLYASMTTEALDEQLEVNQPLLLSNHKIAYVIVRPVRLSYLAELVAPELARLRGRERREYAMQLVAMHGNSLRHKHSE